MQARGHTLAFCLRLKNFLFKVQIRDSIKVTFSKASGLHFNIAKCELSIKNLVQITWFLVSLLKVKYLGIEMGKNQNAGVEDISSPLVISISSRYLICGCRDPSLSGGSLEGKVDGLSWLIYTALALDVPTNLLHQLIRFYLEKQV